MIKQPASAAECKEMAKRMRLKALEMAYRSGKKGSHIGPALSCIEILAVLYGNVMRLDKTLAAQPERDRFISGKAHGVLAQYTALHEIGLISDDELDTFQENDSIFGGHPTRDLQHGLEYTGGSLGMALSFGVGMALDAKRKQRNHRVFILLGDGELDEGANWEALMSAAHFQLDGLTVVVDQNGLQNDGRTDDIMKTAPLSDRLHAFGYHVKETDGHDIEGLIDALSLREPDKPCAVIAKTVKGKGVSFMEGVREWHHSPLSEKQYETAVAETLGA